MCIHFKTCFMGRCIWVIVTYPRSFSRFQCMVSEKLISTIFSHFPFLSKYVHPLIAILLWEVHNDDRNMLRKFQIDPVYRSRAMAKTSFCPVKIQHQQLEGAYLNVEANSCSVDPTKGYLHKKTTMNQQPSHHEATETNACSNKKHLTAATFDFQVCD